MEATMKTLKTTKKLKLPATDSIQKLAEFWDKHDVTDFADELQEVVEPVFKRPRRDEPAGEAAPPAPEQADVNLAAEFYIMSLLHRLGADAALSIGNKKAVDITVVRGEGEAVTIDVKGVRGRFDWPVENVKIPAHDRHYIVLVSFEGRIDRLDKPPSVWVVPARDLPNFTRQFGGNRTNVLRAKISREGDKYKDAWEPLLHRSSHR
jgi:hypothetical protein